MTYRQAGRKAGRKKQLDDNVYARKQRFAYWASGSCCPADVKRVDHNSLIFRSHLMYDLG